MIALNQAHYESLFRETPALQQQIPQWVDSIHSHVPIASDGAKLLAERASTDGRLRRRLRSIAERGHLEQVTIERIRQHLNEAVPGSNPGVGSGSQWAGGAPCAHADPRL